jgi:hypothetical protein
MSISVVGTVRQDGVTEVLLGNGLTATAAGPDAVTIDVVDTDPTTLTTVVHASPVGGGYVTPLMFDDTATTGGLYGWTGADYTKIGLATS